MPLTLERLEHMAYRSVVKNSIQVQNAFLFVCFENVKLYTYCVHRNLPDYDAPKP